MRFLAALLAFMLLSVPAQAQAMCLPYANFVKTLKDKFGEVSTGKGISADIIVIEIFTSPDTFTILATRTDGMACIIAAGRGWEATPKSLGEDT